MRPRGLVGTARRIGKAPAEGIASCFVGENGRGPRARGEINLKCVSWSKRQETAAHWIVVTYLSDGRPRDTWRGRVEKAWMEGTMRRHLAQAPRAFLHSSEWPHRGRRSLRGSCSFTLDALWKVMSDEQGRPTRLPCQQSPFMLFSYEWSLKLSCQWPQCRSIDS